jgi:hypothetical protein
MLVRRFGPIALGLTLALGGTNAANADASGMQLQQWCSAKDSSSESLICSAYIAGFMMGLFQADGLLDTAQKAFCIPRSVTVGQAVLITKKFMREHPEELHEDASLIAARALLIAYHCKRSNEAGR